MTNSSMPADGLFAQFARRPLAWGAALVMLCGGVAYLVLPIIPFVRDWNDFGFVYAAGRTWLKGVAPYDVDVWRAQWKAIVPSFEHGNWPSAPFMYPPHWCVFAVPLALLPWVVAERLWDVVNLGCAFGAVALAMHMMVGERKERWRDPELWLIAAFALLNPAMRWAVWECQMALLPAFAVLCAFWACREQRQGWLALFSFLAVLKPQIAFMPILYLVLNGGAVGVFWGMVASAVVGGLSLAHTDLAALPAQLQRSYALHMEIDYNKPHSFYNVSAILSSFDGAKRLLFLSPLLGLSSVLGLSYLRRRWAESPIVKRVVEHPLWLPGSLLALSVALTPLHGYDLVLYTPVVLLTYEMRPRWLGWLVVLFIELAARGVTVGRLLHDFVQPMPPYFTVAAAICAMFALRFATRNAGSAGDTELKDPAVVTPGVTPGA